MQITLNSSVSALAEYIQNISGIDVNKCYQCGKCSAGCTVSRFIQESPTKLIRLIQLGQKETVYNSKTPYICASCNTCSVRCPMEIDTARLMEAIRISARSQNLKSPVNRITKFSDAFLDFIRTNGKLFELGLLIKYKILSMTPFQDVDLGPVMLKNRKLGFIPQKIKNRKRIRQIFERSNYFLEHKKKSH